MKIKVIHPFALRTGSGKAVVEFPVGVHYVTDEEYGHWFFKDCLKEGRAVLLADEGEGEDDSGELVAPTREELLKLKNTELEELLGACGVTPVPNTKKADLVDLLLAGHEGVTLVKGQDGVYVQRAD